MVTLTDVFSGFQKGAAFGMVISILACQFGLNASGGAKGVGKATTNSVVTTLVVLLGVDFAITFVQIAL